MDLAEAIMKRFLRKLLNLNIWGGRHTELKNLQKALPSHLRGSKESKKAIKELLKKQFLNLHHQNSFFWNNVVKDNRLKILNNFKTIQKQ